MVSLFFCDTIRSGKAFAPHHPCAHSKCVSSLTVVLTNTYICTCYLRTYIHMFLNFPGFSFDCNFRYLMLADWHHLVFSFAFTLPFSRLLLNLFSAITPLLEILLCDLQTYIHMYICYIPMFIYMYINKTHDERLSKRGVL